MNTDKLLEILSVQTHSYEQEMMFEKICEEVATIHGCVLIEDQGNIYVIKGEADIYPCMVSHMDTVHRLRDDLHPLVFGDYITGFDRKKMRQAGIGGDDKVGVFITLECLRELDVFKAAFFRDEEVGCNGSYLADMSFFKDCSFVLQCDRKGNSDFVTNTSVELSGKEFQKAIYKTISGHGYKFSDGMMTDVMALKENGLDVACANMSCGYHRPHTDEETVSISQVENCLEMCLSLFKQFGTRKFPHIGSRRKYDRYDRYEYDTKSGGWKKKDNAVDIQKCRDILSKYGLDDLSDEEALQFGSGMVRRLEYDQSLDQEPCCPNCKKEMVYMGVGGNFCEWCGMYEEDMQDMEDDLQEDMEEDDDIPFMGNVPRGIDLPRLPAPPKKDLPF